MQGWQRWAGVGVAAGVIYALMPRAPEAGALQEPPAQLQIEAPLGKLSEAPVPAQPEPDLSQPDLSQLDLLQLELSDDRVTSPLPNQRSAELTLDPALQRATLGVMKRYAVPEAGAILMDTRSGNLL